MLKIINQNEKFDVFIYDSLILSHTPDSPFVFLGTGNASFDMYRGNYNIKDYVVQRIPLSHFEILSENKVRFFNGEHFLIVNFRQQDDKVFAKFTEVSKGINRFWFRIKAQKDEKIYGCGEQLSHLNLRGKNFPLWTSEPGVGRNKNSYITWQADTKDKAGGDYYTTNYPQPTYISTRKYYLHLQTTAYCDFDFRHDDFHELQAWHKPEFIMFEKGVTYLEIISKLADFFGKQPPLPEWSYNGIILGLQGGTEIVQNKLDKALKKGLDVSALWCQDWEGINITSFGKRLWWDWKWCEKTYPNLDKKIWELKEKGIKFLGYINPFVIKDDSYYTEALANNYLALTPQMEVYDVDFGEFLCGIVDLTNPQAFSWFKEKIKKNLIEFGLDGWMADFGEYLPTDAVLQNGAGELMHNLWPVLWAKANYEAVLESGNIGKIMYFMRAGFSGTGKYCTLLWAGDQCVDWSLDDGLASVIPAALSSGLTGNAFSHSDIGGYTSLHGLKRTKELFMRWAEMSAFTPIMRTHEGNRPYDNHQFDTDDETLNHLIKMTKIHKAITCYTKSLVEEASQSGIPVQRPLFLHYEEDPVCYDIQYQYLYGKDILVAPIYNENEITKNLYLPSDTWIHLWTSDVYQGGYLDIEAPIGKPAVFYRKDSQYKDLFATLKHL